MLELLVGISALRKERLTYKEVNVEENRAKNQRKIKKISPEYLAQVFLKFGAFLCLH